MDGKVMVKVRGGMIGVDTDIMIIGMTGTTGIEAVIIIGDAQEVEKNGLANNRFPSNSG